MMLTGPGLNPKSGAKPRQLIVLLHGYGADGADLIDLAPAVVQMLPDARFVAPNAPERCEVGFGYQWFSLRDWSPTRLAAGAKAAMPALDAFITAEQEAHGLTDAQTLLLGFSQGCMMALQVGLRRAQPLAGIVGMSGALTGAEVLGAEIKSRPPVCLVHGQLDQIVPFEALGLTAAALKAVGVPVEDHARPGLGHGIDPEGLGAAVRFMQRVLA